MKKELNIFLTALLFYTRIPVRKNIEFSNDLLSKATRYFPFVGFLVGGIGALTFMGANYFFSIHLSLVISIITMVFFTGAFHEDALADFCDGFGGGYTKEKILLIMKDSRIGTYGAIALILLFFTKILLLSEIKTSQIPIILIAANVVSRINPVLLIFTAKYVRLDESSKCKAVDENKSPYTLIIALIFGIVPFAFLSLITSALIFIMLLLIFIIFRYYVIKKIEGYTGDVLGALQQFSEIAFYLTYLIVEKLK